MSAMSGNVCPDTTAGSERQDPASGPGTNTINDYLFLATSQSTPSSGQDHRSRSDKSNTVSNINQSYLQDNVVEEDAVVPVKDAKRTGPGDRRQGPGDDQEGVTTIKTGVKKDVKTTEKKEDAGGRDTGVVCVHDDEGTCNIHGPGAKKMTTPARVTRTYKNGTTKSVLIKKKWFKCEQGRRGGMMTQQRLSFSVVQDAKGTVKRDNKGNCSK